MYNRLAMYFLMISFCIPSQAQSVYDIIDQSEVFTWNTNAFLNNGHRIDGGTNIRILDFNLTMTESDVISPDYRSVNSEGEVKHTLPFNLKTYVGYTEAGGKAALTIGEGFIYGVIEQYSDQYFIEPLIIYDKDADTDDYIVYNSRAVNDPTSKTCGAVKQEKTEEEMQPYFQRFSQGLCYTVEYGICHDYSMIDKYGSQAMAEAFAIGVTNAAITNYDDEFLDEVSIQISGQYSITCMGCEPWTISSDPNDILDHFSDWASVHLDENPINISHDVASLWTDVDLDGNVVGVAYLGGTCFNTRYNVLQDFLGTPDEKRVLLAHELGHNFNATHDASGSNYIMAPSITVTGQWSSKSITRVEAFYKDAPCLDICPGITPQVNMLRGETPVMEVGMLNQGWCNGSYIPLQVGVEMSHIIDDSVVVAVEIDEISTACQDFDFRLLVDTITFYNGGNLKNNISLEILDDFVVEDNDTLILNLSLVSGNAEVGAAGSHTIVIYNVGDDFTTLCCTSSSQITIGNPEYYFNGVFFGTQDAKSRTLLRSEDLQASGLTSGYIDLLSFFVELKHSTGPYENFRIGMKQVNLTEMSHTWYNTTEVYHGDVNTIEGQWNDFPFYQPFYWDGSSDLYIDFCFDNREAVGRDYIMGWDPTNQGYDLFSYRAANYSVGCDLNTGSFFYNQDRNPQVRLRKSGAPVWETQVTQSQYTAVKAGETSHFYSENGKVMASVKNLGSVDISCINLSIINSGNGRSNLPGSIHHFSNKNYLIEADNENAYYELKLYFTYNEMNIWSGLLSNLNIIKSETPLPQSINDDEILGIYMIEQNQGAFSDYMLTATISGSGYIAVTDRPLESSDVIIGNGSYVINNLGGKVMLTSLSDSCFLAYPDQGEWIIGPCNHSSYGTTIDNGNLILSESGNNLYFKSSSSTFTKVNVDDNGSVILTENVPAPSQAIYLPDDDLALLSSGSGIIFTTSSNKCFKLVVEDSGQLLAFQMKCPN